MKKIYIVLAGLAVVLGSACCNKIEDGKDVMSQDVTIDINVAELNPSTKAIKSGWANGDIINVYLSDATSYVPDFTLTYNDEKWTASAMTDAVKSRLQASGRIKGFWEASNTAATTGGDWDRFNSYIYFNNEYENTTGIKDYLSANFNVEYTYSKGKLTASIDTWNFENSSIQIAVTGLEHQNFCMYQENIQAFNSYDIEYAKISPTRYSVARIAGTPNEDGLAFVGNLRTTIYSGSTFTVDLFDYKNDKKYSFSKTLNAAMAPNESTVIAIKIPFSKFSEVVD
ncbi:MAG: hypothetical protein E7124_01660 [Bacteroidales bacterium]|nr:hypothetical protein [Bacteroidales bacterium]